ncbi:ankyrin repeat domain-containing protein 13C-like isoform X2 [Pecten maximus]|uniref:ankyrin repeat domain-containing protein 13C-like isoform X1 n=1 Tax=Pecten maximus TaxID=6579 RepID=UPI001458D2A2|nr:ankyrin repeat domain-containing protein 13C-like isoform X1 [Pecten maximus]XP_033737391.1 ankyrin repeat domain-containing protein 13C-like isoform X2 [Pecten maximus]
MAADLEGYPLHKCVFNDDKCRLSQLIRVHDVAQKDIHGNTPLHLAVILGHKECIHLLLAHGAPVRIKNTQGWTPLAESISFGDRQTILCLLRKLKQQSRESLENRRPSLVQALRDIGDFYLELKWDFQSWVPLVSRILPSDVCKIHKKGCCIRLDTTLVDFNDMHWERGDITFVFNGEEDPQHSLTVLDNKLFVFQRIRYEESEQEMDDEVDILMSSDIMAAQMSTKNITFTRAQSGWLFREDKTEMVGDYEADYYFINGLTLDSRKRREHLSPEDVQKNKAIMENLTKGTWDNCDFQRRPSLNPPERPNITWEEYMSAPAGKPPCLGRQWIPKGSSKSFKATVAMSKSFPMDVSVLLDVLEVIAPFKQFQKLRDFMTTKLPDGFPVKIEIPVFPTVTAKVTFNSFEWKEDLPDRLFYIPPEYIEDPKRFPDL